MLFQVINDKNVPVMRTEYETCLPDMRQIKSISSVGYKFKLDGKIISTKKAIEYINSVNERLGKNEDVQEDEK